MSSIMTDLGGILGTVIKSQKVAIDTKAPSFNPTLTGLPKAPTAPVGTNTTQIATTAFVLANSGGGSAGGVSFINKPTIVTPTEGYVGYSGLIYSDNYATGATFTAQQDYIEWECGDSDFSVIYDSYYGNGNLESWMPNIGLTEQLVYIRVRKGADNHLSEWSTVVSYTTPITSIIAPVLTIAGYPDNVNSKPYFKASEFLVFGGTTQHLSTDWELRLVGDDSLLWSSYNDTVNLTSITIPMGYVLENTNYIFRVKYNGVDYGSSSWVSVYAKTRNLLDYGNYLAVAHSGPPNITIYGNDIDTAVKLTPPSPTPPSTGMDLDFSRDGVFMAVAHLLSPFLSIYKRTGDNFTKLINPTDLPPGTANSAVFSNSGEYLAVGLQVAPFVMVYKVTGETFTKIPGLNSLPTGEVKKVTFSNNDDYLTVVSVNSPYLFIYKRTGDDFVRLPNPSVLIPNVAYCSAFSGDDNYLVVGHMSGKNITIYKRSGDTFTKLTDPAITPPNLATGASFGFNDTYLAISHWTSPFITIYKRSGDTFTKLANPAVLPTDMPFAIAFDPTGTYLTIGHDGVGKLITYKRNGDTFTKLANPSVLIPDRANGIKYYVDATA